MKKTALPLLPILAALAVPAGASAATYAGGDPASATAADLVQCTENGERKDCTIIADTVAGKPVAVPAGSVITAWSGYFGESASVRLQLLRRGANGSFTSVDTGYGEYPADGFQAMEAHVPVPATGQYTIGVDLTGGSIAASADTSSRMFATDAPVWMGDTETGLPSQHALDIAVRVEPDADKDGLGDETEDTPTTPGGGGDGGDGGQGGGQSEPDFAIQPQGILGSESQPYFKLFSHIGGDENVDVKVQLKVGKKVVSTQTDEDTDYGSSDTYYMHTSAAVRKQILKKGTLRATAIATVQGTKSGRTKKYTQAVKLLRGGDARYDGTYRGDGPVVVVVKNGVVAAVSQSMFLFCSRSGDNMTRAMETVSDQMPALVGKDGSFSAKGSSGYDTFTYRGKLSRTGTSKGYFSLFHTNVYFGDSGITSEDCYQASNWTAKRS